jgi:predicted DsbA family dithiol-disulfide isomerase
VRLHSVQATYGERVRLHWRTCPLIPDHRPGRRCTPQTQAGRQRVAEEEPRALFVPPPLESALPASSIPALIAAKCAARQGEAAFERFHQRLFVAHFHDHLDISRQDVLWRLAHDSRLDLPRFQQDYTSDEAYQAVLHDYAEGAAWFGVSALPTVVFNEKVSLVGAVSEERYRLLLDWLLAGEPGGLIPLQTNPSGTGTTGHSRLGHQ